MIDFMENNPNIGIVGPRLQNSDGSFQLSFGKYPSLINEYKTRKQQMRCNDRLNQAKCREKEEYLKSGRVDWVSGAALMIRHSIFDQVGGYDINYFMYFEDSDLCLRAEKQGYSAYWLSEYPVIHHKGKSYTTADLKIYEEYRKSQLYYYRKNKSILEQNILRLYLLVKYSLQYLSRNKRTVARNILKNVL
jgi:GT2 family glycosyltransferase